MTCQECIDSLYPDNPTVAQFNGLNKPMLKPLCYGCSNSIGGKPDLPTQETIPDKPQVPELKFDHRKVDLRFNDTGHMVWLKFPYNPEMIKDIKAQLKDKEATFYEWDSDFKRWKIYLWEDWTYPTLIKLLNRHFPKTQ